MSAQSILLWAIAGSFGLWGAMLLLESETPVTSLEDGLGPKVATQPL